MGAGCFSNQPGEAGIQWNRPGMEQSLIFCENNVGNAVFCCKMDLVTADMD
jgi:hypothetical protein